MDTSLLGLAFYLPFLGVGLMLIISGIGLFRRKNWARRMGMLSAGLLEMASIVTAGLFVILNVEVKSTIGFLMFALIFISNILALLLALYMLHILGGKRMVNWTGGTTIHPAWIWQIFAAYLCSILGIVPALLLLVRKPATRIVAQVYAIFLIFALPIARILAAAITSGLTMTFGDSPTGVSSSTASPMGQLLNGLAVFFFIGLCIYTILYLNKPEVRAYFENREE